MGDTNPYLPNAEAPWPTRRYQLRIIDADKRAHVVDVDPGKLSCGAVGRPGSILGIALAAGAEIDHACGGVCACATCHVIVREGLDTCNEPSDAEENQLDQAYGLTPQSRLACQCVPDGSRDIVVEIPAWNRNLARETDH